jgi:putative hydrolase of the HAD superfamily
VEPDREAAEEAIALRAVVFDLWDTLVLWPSEGYERVAEGFRRYIPNFDEVWTETYFDRATRPLDVYFRGLGLDEDAVAACVQRRTDHTRNVFIPVDGAVETLDELARRGVKRGVISVCSSDVETVWEETELAGRFEDVVLSSAVGLRKPDPAIYLLACERLGVEPEECLFVGDGANDELAGAARVGMHAVCILPPGRSEAGWPEARGWEPTIARLEEVLALV